MNSRHTGLRLVGWLRRSMLFGLVAWLALVQGMDAAETVRLERVPDGGLQPQIALGNDGTVHLVYFQGNPAAGDLYYCQRGPTGRAFSEPIRINSVPLSAIATGTIRGAQITLGAGNSVHVAWNGSRSATPRGPNEETPLLYSRLVEGEAAFSPQRNLIQSAYGLDGGSSLAADSKGMVYVTWHAGTGHGEAARRVWLTRSQNNGESFSPEVAIDSDLAGVCGCCGMEAGVAPDGRLMILYRSATRDVHRDMYLLISDNQGARFSSRRIDNWEINACPMSSAAFGHGQQSSWAAWETAEQVFLAQVPSAPGAELESIAAPGRSPRRKHPALAVDAAGQVLFVWTEGTSWNRGGGFSWQRYDSQGQPLGKLERRAGIPAWSFAAAYAESNGRFVILY